MPSSFDYAVIRVVPRVERAEFINAGVVLWCLERGFLGVRVYLDEERLRALCPECDVELVRDHLAAFERVCAGGEDSGPVGKLSKRERFHWLVAPRSTVIQISPVHSGLCESAESALDDLLSKFVTSDRP